VPQCGYRQAGQIMTAAALLEKIRSPRIRASTPLWPGTCAVAALIFVFARASAAQLKSPARSQLGLDTGAERQNQPNIIYG
jgi:aerobic-type carbon monoxide dehydrogenase small subunit (CoxS/CutS family)